MVGLLTATTKSFRSTETTRRFFTSAIMQEKANEYVVLTMVREGNTFSFYFNGELNNTYTEEDTEQSAKLQA